MLLCVVMDWMGLEGWVKKFLFQMCDMNMNGDKVLVKGEVVDKFEDNFGELVVKIDVWLENGCVGKIMFVEYIVWLLK